MLEIIRKRKLPRYVIGCLLLLLAVNFTAYNGGRFLAGDRPGAYWGIWLDEQIPFIPWMIYIYILTFAFWAVNYTMSLYFNKKDAVRFVAAEITGKLVCMAFFVFLPTTMPRPTVGDTGFTNLVMRFVYLVDESGNLFPSIHCYASWFCVMGIWKNPYISKWYKAFSVIFAFAIFFSTMAVKQHVFVDVIGGVALAQACYLLSGVWAKRSRFAAKLGKEDPDTVS